MMDEEDEEDEEAEEQAREDVPGDNEVPKPITIEIDRQLEKLDQVIAKVQEEVSYWAKKGVYTKVRVKFRGKTLLPDIPVAAFLAAEAASFWWTGIFRALAFNFGGRLLFDVELVSDAEPHLTTGQEYLLEGEIDDALESFYKAAAIDRNLAPAHLHIGVCLKIKGERDKALESFRKARNLDPHGEVGRQANEQIKKLSRDDE